jgi:hypothetical protein
VFIVLVLNDDFEILFAQIFVILVTSVIQSMVVLIFDVIFCAKYFCELTLISQRCFLEVLEYLRPTY